MTQLRSLKLLIAKTPLLHMLNCMNWLTYGFWTLTEGWEFDRSHGAGTSSPSYWQQVEEQAFCYRSYIYIQQECGSVLVKLHPITFYRTVFVVVLFCFGGFCVYVLGGSTRFLGWMPLFVFFGLTIVSCSTINSLILWLLWPLVFVLNNILILGIWHSAISHLPGCFAPGPSFRISDSTSSYSTWIFCRGVSGFATDCPGGVWCRGLTTCLLHVSPAFGNRPLHNSWAIGLTWWKVYLHFFLILTFAIVYVLIHHIIFSALSLLLK